MNIYLAGAISKYIEQGKFDDCVKWRQDLKHKLEALGYKCFDPCENFDKNLGYSHSAIVRQNMFYVNKCDILVVNIEYLKESPGTLFEMTMAYLQHKPIIAFGDYEIIDEVPHLYEMVSQCCDDINEAIKYIVNMYGQLV